MANSGARFSSRRSRSGGRRACLLVAAVAMCVLAITATAGGDVPAPPLYRDHTRLESYLDEKGGEHPVRSRADWEKRRRHILAGMQAVMGPLPGPERKVPLNVEVLEESATDAFVRKKIRFSPEKDDRVPAYLFLPKGGKKRKPAVLCLHQTTGIGKGEPAGLGGLPNLHYARELAERGYVTLAPDYPNFGEYAFDPYARGYASGSMKAIWNNMRAIDLLQSLPEVDQERIGCIGHSLGGHNTMFTGAFDARIKALVSSCGFTAFGAYYQGNLTGWTGPAYMPRIREVKREGGWAKNMPFDFHEVVAAFAPRAFFTNSPLKDDNFEVGGVREVMERAAPVYRLFGAEEKLVAVYPDAAHDFPTPQRQEAYAFLDRWLQRK